ncbi:putative quinol monooxygenase [Spirillospora sp. NPDC050679]
MSYDFLSPIDGDTILSLEIWADRAALDAHLKHPHTRGFLTGAARLTDGAPDLEVYDAYGTGRPARHAAAE